jgi:hypothetical protein
MYLICGGAGIAATVAGKKKEYLCALKISLSECFVSHEPTLKIGLSPAWIPGTCIILLPG